MGADGNSDLAIGIPGYRIVSAAAAGLVTVLRGNAAGPLLTLVLENGRAVQFNPYGTAFMALLAGMFTERAYGLLVIFVDQFEAKLKAVIGDSGPRPRHPNQDGDS